ncbi:hydroxyethylthiazole kinase [Pseudomonas nitritireducens]|uniref:Hydroxyethylthiazole kinase n=1 Tax=Pseudomonas nitroreducens TaxID=46680 RepID=A0A7W7KQ59_PSENT|nr:M23 family metallopeptidase [Pseudomonas nitritireducens]MBB4866937.1 hydroxyethylthiazole kinase [Pseudomonas nitritireducens]
MIISPPFLPSPIAGESDEAFIDRAMVGGTLGRFPLSYDLNWHGGMHLKAPEEGGVALKVRAIADGEIAYFRTPTAESGDATHPLNYRGKWTDDGCIVIKHETEIGEGDNAKVTYFSIYMHLSKITLTSPSVGQKIYRKDALGEAGKIYGEGALIHFEIIADQSQIAKLIGRSNRELNHQSSNGRTDSCWGDMYFFVPPEVLAYSTPPVNRALAENSSAVVYRSPSMPTEVQIQEGPSTTNTSPPTVGGYEWAVAAQLQSGIFVQISYDKGDCTLTSYYLSGNIIGSIKEEQVSGIKYEYNLYETAAKFYPKSPSAGYELLRFGRVLSTDPLTPANAAHWRKIKLPGKSGLNETEAWVNLNGPTVTKFSDADFPQWRGWNLIEDDADTDSHCNSLFIRSILTLDERKTVSDNFDAVAIASSSSYEAYSAEEQEKLSDRFSKEKALYQARLDSIEMQSKLKKLICKFPTEWRSDDFDTRYGWLKKVGDRAPLTPEKYESLKSHSAALSFWGAANLPSIESRHWHFNPREFIYQFRKCGWISREELKTVLEQAPAAGRQRAEGLRVQMNKMMSKYLINSTKLRTAHFFSQVGIETGWWQYREEIGNERYFRTMYEVITSTEAGEDYDRAVELQRNLPSGRRPIELPNPGPHPKPTIERPDYVATRPAQVLQKASGMDNGAANSSSGGQIGDGARFHGRGFLQITGRRNYKSYEKYRGLNFTNDPNPSLLSSDDYNACDASGFYWVREKLSRLADQGESAETSRRVGSTINRGNANGIPNHNPERQSAFTNFWKKLNDKS